MEDVKIVLFIYCDNPELKETIVKKMSQKVPTLHITTEYIPDDFDTEDTIKRIAELPDNDRIGKINSSYQRAFTNTGVKEKKQLFIIDLENIPVERIPKISFSAQYSNCRLITMYITEISYRDGKQFIFLKSPEFALFAKFFQASTDNATIIDSTEKVDRHKGIVKAWNDSYSELILVDLSAVSESERTMYEEFAPSFDFSVLKIQTGTANVKDPTMDMDGKPFNTKSVTKQRTADKHTVVSKNDTPDDLVKKEVSEVTLTEFWKKSTLRKLLLTITSKFNNKTIVSSDKDTVPTVKKDKYVRSQEDIETAAQHIKNLIAESSLSATAPTEVSQEIQH